MCDYRTALDRYWEVVGVDAEEAWKRPTEALLHAYSVMLKAQEADRLRHLSEQPNLPGIVDE